MPVGTEISVPQEATIVRVQRVVLNAIARIPYSAPEANATLTVSESSSQRQ